ncbi:MAG TPA: hypothetical protein VN752_02145 [Solirubrobacterales bacterium]|nr:hypothetical protein [Solirubrobacterales bacterium]
MLFDTRGRRRHVIRVVYATLALLMGASLFLVVGPFSIADIFNTASTTDPATVLHEQAERIEAKLRTEPDNEELLLALTRARVAAGNAQTELNSETGIPVITGAGREDLIQASEAWNRYLQQTDEPNPSGALLMARTLFSLAESSPTTEEADAAVDEAVKAQRIAAEARPNVGSLTSLAIYQYFAGDFAAGDATAKEAQAKAPSQAEAKEVQKQLVEYRARGKSYEKQKQEFAKAEGERGKEALQNPLGGLGGGGTLGQ